VCNDDINANYNPVLATPLSSVLVSPLLLGKSSLTLISPRVVLRHVDFLVVVTFGQDDVAAPMMPLWKLSDPIVYAPCD